MIINFNKKDLVNECLLKSKLKKLMKLFFNNEKHSLTLYIGNYVIKQIDYDDLLNSSLKDDKAPLQEVLASFIISAAEESSSLLDNNCSLSNCSLSLSFYSKSERL